MASADGSDSGRFDVTKQEIDRGMFKFPTLRDVTKTAPYIHDGSTATLEETTRLMARHQVGRELSDPQVTAVTSFLGALKRCPRLRANRARLGRPTQEYSGVFEEADRRIARCSRNIGHLFTGDAPKELRTKPQLPPSGLKTSRHD